MTDNVDLKFTAKLNADPAVKEAQKSGEEISKALNLQTGDKGIKRMQSQLREAGTDADKLYAKLLEANREFVARTGTKSANKMLANAQQNIPEYQQWLVALQKQSSLVGKINDKYTRLNGETSNATASANEQANAAQQAAEQTQAQADAAQQTADNEANAAKSAEDLASAEKETTENVENVNGALDETSDKIDDAKNKAEDLKETIGDVKPDAGELPQEELVVNIDTNADVTSMSVLQLIAYIKHLKAEMRDLEKVEDPTQEQSQRYDELSNAVQRATDQLKQLKQESVTAAQVMDAMNGAIQGLANAKGPLSGVLSVLQSFGPVMQQAGIIAETTLATVTSGLSLVITVITTLANIVQSAIERIKRAITSILSAAKRVIEFVIDGIKRVISAISSLVSKISGSLKKAIEKVGGSADKAFSMKNLRRTLQMLTKYIFGFRSFFFLYRRLRKAIGEGIENLVQFQSATNETNTAISELRTSLLYLKNAWAAAFAPIINYVYPVLVMLIDLLASVGNAIARFFAALTGADTVLQAVRVDAGDYAESLNNIGGSAGNAADEQEKLNDRLAAFDDLNVLGVDKDTDPNSGRGGGGGGLGDNIDPNEMFRRIETPVNRLADLIREAWKTGDAFDLGDLFASSLEKSLDKAHLWLTGEGREKVLKIANLIGTFFDGMLSHEDLGKKFGQVIGDAFDLVCDTINTIITPERMMKFGEQLAGAMNTAIPMIVPKLGETLGNLFRSAIAGFYGWVTTADWKGWGQAVADALNNFIAEMNRVMVTTKGTKTQASSGLNGWEMLGIDITEFANGMITMLGTAIANSDWRALLTGLMQLFSNIDISSIWSNLLNVGSAIQAGAKGVWDEFRGSAPREAVVALQPLATLLENMPDLISEIVWAIKKILPSFSDVMTWMQDLPDKIDRIISVIEQLIPIIVAIADAIGATIEQAVEWSKTPVIGDIMRGSVGGAAIGGAIGGKPGAAIGGAVGSNLGAVAGIQGFGLVQLVSNIERVIGKNAELDDSFKRVIETIKETGVIANRTKGDLVFDDVSANIQSMVTTAKGYLNEIPEKFTEMTGVADTQSANIKGTYDNTFENVKQGSIDSAKVVQDNFLLASDSIKDSFIQTWDEIKKAVSEGGSMYVALTDGVNNTLKSLLNGMINGINTSITKPLQDISKSFNILRTLDVNGTRPFAGIPYLNIPTIPHLAQGAVIPPNREFMAVLGDQSSGTNIEAPLDTIKQAVGEEFAPYAEAIVEAVMQVVSAVNNKELKIGDKEIGRANDRYNTQRSIIRGTML